MPACPRRENVLIAVFFVHHGAVVVPVGKQLLNALLQVCAPATRGHAIREEKPEHQGEDAGTSEFTEDGQPRGHLFNAQGN